MRGRQMRVGSTKCQALMPFFSKSWVGQFRSKHKRIAGSGCVMLDINKTNKEKNSCFASLFYTEQIRNMQVFLTTYE